MRRSAIACVFLASTVAVSSQQAPPRDSRPTASAPAAPSGTGAIGGSVTVADDGRPVRFAYIVLLGTTTGIVKVTSSDADGRFVFNDLPVDRYTVGASKPPYLGTIAGARRPGRTGTPIAVASGQKVTDVAIRMSMGASISGLITGENGQPAADAMVGLMQWRQQSGERTLAPVSGQTGTDEQGRYRIFGLLPGEYLVTSMRLRTPARTLTAGEVDAAIRGENVPQPPATPSVVRNAPVYFPGTTQLSDAAPVVLAAGESRVGVDFRLQTVQAARVEGSVTADDGQPVGGVPLMMLTSVGSGTMSYAISVRVGPDGRFTIPNVSPGSHTIVVNGAGPTAGQFARTQVETTGSDLFGVQLTMRPAMSFSGRLVFEGMAQAPPVSGRRIPIRSLVAPSSGGATPTIGATNQSGVFAVSNIMPGRYMLGGPLAFGPTTDTMTWTVGSVVVDGRDLTDLPIEIADAAPKDVVVTYTDRWQELSGRLQSQSGAPVSDHTIVVFPEDRAYWLPGTRRIVTTRPGTDGRFVLSGKGLTTLPPGKYLLAAVTDVGKDEQFDPAFLAQLVPASVPIALGPGEKKLQELVIR